MLMAIGPRLSVASAIDPAYLDEVILYIVHRASSLFWRLLIGRATVVGWRWEPGGSRCPGWVCDGAMRTREAAVPRRVGRSSSET